MCGTRSRGYPARKTKTDSGAPVDVWTEWRPDFLPLDIDRCPAMVVAGPHPDDETLGLGTTAALLAGRGVTVQAYPRRPVHTPVKLAIRLGSRGMPRRKVVRFDVARRCPSDHEVTARAAATASQETGAELVE